MTVTSEVLNRAIVAITGFGGSTYPHRAFGDLERTFGVDAPEVGKAVGAVLATLDSFEPDWDEVDLPEATHQARAFVASRHPELGEDALDALTWLYSFEMR